MDSEAIRRTRKRARTSDSDSSDFTKSPDFWFPDGSVVIQAHTTQFRVHMSILSLHSTVFRDMFEIPQPENGEPSVEGCPLVQVSDSVEDFTVMLSAMYKLVLLLVLLSG